MSDLITPYFIGHKWINEVGAAMCSITDDNGIFAFDCYESDANELLKRINGFEALKQQLKTARVDAVRDAIEYADEKSKWPDDWIGFINGYVDNLEGK